MSIDEPAMGMPVGGTVPGAVTGFPVSTVAGEAVASRLMYESSTPAHVVSQTVGMETGIHWAHTVEAMEGGIDPSQTEPQASSEIHTQLEQRARRVGQNSKSVQWFSILDSILCVLNTFALGWKNYEYAWVPLILMIGPVSGYKGARRLNKNQALVYVVFCFLNLGYRTLDAVYAVHIHAPHVLFSMLMVIIEVFITRVVVRFWRLLCSLSDGELIVLRHYCSPEIAGLVVYW